MIQAIAPTMHQSRLFGVTSPDQAAAILLKGYELGLSFTASFEFLQVVQGKTAMIPRGALAMILNSPLCAGVKIDDLKDNAGSPTGCTVWMKRTNGFEYTVTWTMTDAIKAGVVKPESGWASYPGNMLRWRAVGFCADVVFPDVIGGMKRADELGADLTPEGDVVEGQWKQVVSEPVQPIVAPEPAPTPVAVITLDELVAKYGAEAVMVAANGTIPGNDADVLAAAQVLAANNA
jgi:hypothetical protein